jgi:hypothetical protein
MPPVRVLVVLTSALALASSAATASADSTPVGPLPPGPVATIQSSKGELVAVALPHRSGGRVWRVARPFDGSVVRQVSEADVGSSVVLVFRAAKPGSTTISLALTRGDTSAVALESRRFQVRVRP